jgi:hypothetical protein
MVDNIGDEETAYFLEGKYAPQNNGLSAPISGFSNSAG